VSVKVIITDELAIAAGRIAQAHRGDSIEIRYDDDMPSDVWFVATGGETRKPITYIVNDENGFIDPPLRGDPS
jgi:hypothetical protein